MYNRNLARAAGGNTLCTTLTGVTGFTVPNTQENFFLHIGGGWSPLVNCGTLSLSNISNPVHIKSDQD
jgi:hypothetical protein